MNYEDTYFLNAKEALRVAELQNKNDKYHLQICYYEGEKIDSTLVNLVHLPLETLGEDLIHGTYRLPTKLDFTGLNLSSEIELNIKLHFNTTLTQAKILRTELNAQYLHNIKTANPDFNETLRFYLTANVNTRVMQHITQNIVNALEESGYDVLFDLHYGIEDQSSLKKISTFNPHATININHLNNYFLNEHIFNFVWIQDDFVLEDLKKSYTTRYKDTFYHLIEHLQYKLQEINIKSTYQPFCIDTKVYRLRDEIKREKKIIFIGSSYKRNFDNITNKNKNEISKELFDIYLKNGYIKLDDRKNLTKKWDISSISLKHIFNYIERDLFLKYIINMDIDYSIEVYGYDWELDEQLAKYNKGPISYGEDISKIYNTASYGLVIGGYVMQQRTLEAAASGAIPLIFDCRASNADIDHECFDTSLVFFKRLTDLKKILNNHKYLDLNCIVNKNSYKKFILKIKNVISKG